MANTPEPLHVTLLTEAHCAFCEEAHVLLARLAQEYPLIITTVPFNSPEGLELALRGSLWFPPGIVFNGVPICYGRPSERRLRRELEGFAATKAPRT